MAIRTCSNITQIVCLLNLYRSATMSLLPSIGEISQQHKRRKLQTSSLLSSYESLASIDLNTWSTLDKLSREVKESWLVARFGFVLVNEVCLLLRSISGNVTDSEKKKSCVTVTSLYLVSNRKVQKWWLNLSITTAHTLYDLLRITTLHC